MKRRIKILVISVLLIAGCQYISPEFVYRALEIQKNGNSSVLNNSPIRDGGKCLVLLTFITTRGG